MPRAITCMLNGAEISVLEAIRLRDDSIRRRAARCDFRCAECGHPVRAHKDGDSGAAHVEHLVRNSACTLSYPARAP